MSRIMLLYLTTVLLILLLASVGGARSARVLPPQGPNTIMTLSMGDGHQINVYCKEDEIVIFEATPRDITLTCRSWK